MAESSHLMVAAAATLKLRRLSMNCELLRQRAGELPAGPARNRRGWQSLPSRKTPQQCRIELMPEGSGVACSYSNDVPLRPTRLTVARSLSNNTIASLAELSNLLS